jgi:hypothetical protein
MPLNARDSIADLQSLARAAADEEIKWTKAPFAGVSPSQDDSSDYIMDHDDDNGMEDAKDYSLPLQINNPVSDHPENQTDAVDKSSSSTISSTSQDKSMAINVPPKQQTGRKKTSRSAPKRQSGYGGYNYDYSDYYSETYKMKERSKTKKKNVLNCLFPFFQDPVESDSDSDDESDVHDHAMSSDSSNLSNKVSVNDGRISAGKNFAPQVNNKKVDLAEKIQPSTPVGTTSDVEEAATPATSASATPEPEDLGAKMPDLSTASSSSGSVATVTTANELSSSALDQKTTLKGILKRTVVKRQLENENTRMETEESLQKSLMSSLRGKEVQQTKQRRHILPKYSTVDANESMDIDGDMSNITSKPRRNVTFSSMARVLPVLARTEMSFYLKSLIWWQRNDYDDFKKTGRIIAKAMLQGGSEIWLQTSNAWGKKQSLGNKSTTNNAEYMLALESYGVRVNGDNEEKADDDDVGSKWWCKFGHSRRGLEHVVSIQEGRQRQKLVNLSIQAVLEEQRRQRMIGRKDQKKISSISMQYTSWSKDLALAAANADAEAVETNFDAKAKCRLSHLSNKLLKRGKGTEGQPCASLILSANPAIAAGMLDSHTHRSKSSIGTKDPKIQQQLEESSVKRQAAGFQFQ